MSKENKTNWPEAAVMIAGWISVAVMIYSMASCQARSNEAREESCKTKEVCIN